MRHQGNWKTLITKELDKIKSTISFNEIETHRGIKKDLKDELSTFQDDDSSIVSNKTRNVEEKLKSEQKEMNILN